jgi:hypothetical protein
MEAGARRSGTDLRRRLGRLAGEIAPTDPAVIAGLDPAMHQEKLLAKKMDARVKPAHDKLSYVA